MDSVKHNYQHQKTADPTPSLPRPRTPPHPKQSRKVGEMAKQANIKLGRRGRDLEFPLDFDGKDSVYTMLKERCRPFLHHRFSNIKVELNLGPGVKVQIKLNNSELRAELDDGSGRPNVKCITFFPQLMHKLAAGRFAEPEPPSPDLFAERPTPDALAEFEDALSSQLSKPPASWNSAPSLRSASSVSPDNVLARMMALSGKKQPQPYQPEVPRAIKDKKNRRGK